MALPPLQQTAFSCGSMPVVGLLSCTAVLYLVSLGSSYLTPSVKGPLMIRAEVGVFSFPSLRVAGFGALPPAASALLGRKLGEKTPRGA